jgi:hypothetical protein
MLISAITEHDLIIAALVVVIVCGVVWLARAL